MSYQAQGAKEHVAGMGWLTAAVAAAAIAAGVVVVKNGPGRVCKILVTVATTASQAITVYDNATAGSGTVVAIVPGGSTAGTIIEFNMPCQNGITIGANASLAAGAITLSYS